MQKFGAPTDPAPAPGRVRSAGQRSPPSADQGLCVNPTDRPLMDDITHHRAMVAFCRQRARMDGENEQFWLAEADDWARRLSVERVETAQDDSPAS